MKSKSPFPMKSPLRVQVYGGDTYESPDTVITKTVGEQVGKAIEGIADNAVDYMNLKGKLAKDKSDHGKAMELANLKYGKKSNGEAHLGLTTPSEVGSSFGEVPGVPDLVSKSQTTPNSNSNESSTFTKIVKEVLPYGTNYQGPKMSDKKWNALSDEQKRTMNANVGANKEGIIGHDGYRILEINKKNNNVASSSGANFNGSPVKHNTGAVGSIGNAGIFGGGIAGIAQRISNQAQQRAAKNQQSGSGIFGTIAQAASQGGSVVGSIGQQMGNQAQQRAADASGSTGADPFLPPPNQVAETGSYGGGGDRDMLEMNSNIINNQSIGRNTDITSQLFGSGQRASMLAMKGTPLHHDSEKQAHTHPSKTTTKISGKGEMPGSSYVKGDLVDEDDLETVGLQTQNSTLVQSDDKGAFIKEMSYTGPWSQAGFGEKIRLNNMSRPDYTTNEGDQMNPHNFLFQNTPKK
jgi:hypothetical protein